MSRYLQMQASKILSCYTDDYFEKGRKPAPVGEIREYNGRKFQKQLNGKWKELTKTVVKEAVSDLSKEEISVIREYTGNLFRTVNYYLRTGENISRSLDDSEVSEIIETINNGLDKLPNYKGVVNRFLSFCKGDIEQHLDDFVKGDIIKLPEFTSTTKLKKAPSTIRATDIKLEIKSKTGKDITKYSEMSHEEEVLFKKDTIFEVESVKIAKYKSGMLKGKPSNIIVKIKEL